MPYCFEATHSESHTAEIWASKNEVSDRVGQFRANVERCKSSVDDEVARLNAFIDRCDVTARENPAQIPALRLLHLPLVRDAIGLFSTKCTPIGTATR